MDLNTTWFWLIAFLMTGYAILDGFDFGVGILSLFAKNDKERRVHLNAIGPVWDGNEVWLITGGGALFAAFPVVYATVFSGFYIALMLVLIALIFRAVSFEFRGKVDSGKWRRIWDWMFGFGSLIPAFLFGVAIGNILQGIQINAEGLYTGTFIQLLNPYSIGVGMLSILLFTMHGAIYMAAKSESRMRDRFRQWASLMWIDVVSIYVILTIWTLLASPFLFENLSGNSALYILPVILSSAFIYLPILLKAEKFKQAFICSSVIITAMMAQTAAGLYPILVPSSVDQQLSLSIYNSSSSHLTLETMLIIALIGMPIVIGYSLYIHYTFRGKVKIGKDSY
jgi:cytochrome bd ubiquinol oxidase subunit II